MSSTPPDSITPPSLDTALATAIQPTRDALTARTVCYLQPADEAGHVHLFTATGIWVGRQPADAWHP